MAPEELDDIDRGILYLLQEDARGSTVTNIGERVDVSSSTVGNRIHGLEERGVITGYHPTVDYEKAGLGHHLLVVATVPFRERERVADDIMAVSGVVGLQELLTNDRNVIIELVGHDREGIERSLSELDSLGVTLDRTELVKRDRTQPYDHFGRQFTDERKSG